MSNVQTLVSARGASFGAVPLVMLSWAATAHADIPEYQVVRIIAYQTSCQLEKLRSEDLGDTGVRFHATCQNINSYPDGLVLNCADPGDAYSCEVATEERRFDFMENLREQVDTGK
ncbi:MAG: hypothetical protein AAGI72_08395 [Pseudomonadota bacterium]